MRELLIAARAAAAHAYCPYSHFAVGAALLAVRAQDDDVADEVEAAPAAAAPSPAFLVIAKASAPGLPLRRRDWTAEFTELSRRLHFGSSQVHTDTPRPDALTHHMPAAIRHLMGSARRELLRFEDLHWSELHSAFVDDIRRPGADGLLPCAIGMLAATGNRAERNARSCLASLPVDCASPFVLTARAQFGFEIDATIAQLLASAPHADDEPGWTLDAVMFAITGLRLATGPRVDATWMRLRPVLPRGFDRMRVRGLALDGWRCEIELSRERSDAPACGRYTLTPIDGRSTWRQLVVHHGAETFVAPALAGVEVELPPSSKQPELSSPSTR
jgi:hypothetical protein